MQSSIVLNTSDNKNETSELYIPLVDVSIFEEPNINVDSYSLELLKAGDVGQRYAVVGFVENNKLYLYFRPSFLLEDKPTNSVQDEEKFIEKIPRAKHFSPKDRVFASPKMRGIVHGETLQSIAMQNMGLKGKNPDSKDMSGIFSEIQMGLSFYKLSHDLNLLEWLSRSTKNYTIFSVHPLAKMCFYYDENQNDFKRDYFSTAFNLTRTLEPTSFEKIILAVRNKVLMVKDSKELKEAHNDLLKKIKRNTNYTYFYQEKWKKIQNDKKLIAEHLMRTIYYASGLNGEPDPFEFKNHQVIISALSVAHDYNIPLNLNHIPSDTKEKNRDTALINACRIGDFENVKILVNYDNKKEVINYQNIYGETPIMAAIHRGDLNSANVLLTKGAEVNERLKEAILHNALTNAKKIVEDILINPSSEQRVKTLKYLLAKMTEWNEMKVHIENLSTYGLTLDDLYSEKNPGEMEHFKKIVSEHIITISALGKISELIQIEQLFSKDFFTNILNFYDPYFIGSALIVAIQSSKDLKEARTSTISWLLEKKINTCMPCQMGATALMEAVCENDLETIQKILLHSTASLNLEDVRGWSALVYAVSEKHVAIFNYLLEANAEFNPSTILPIAVKKKDKRFTLEILESLLIATVKRRHMDLLQVLPQIKQCIIDLKEQEITQDAVLESYNKILKLLETNEKENSFLKKIKEVDESKSNLQILSILKPKQIEEERNDLNFNQRKSFNK